VAPRAAPARAAFETTFFLAMIITRLTGGLGNQMFQYAAGLALAQARRTVLKLDVSWFREYPEYEAHNRYDLSCLNITEQFATAEEVDRTRGVALTRMERWSIAAARRLRFYRYAERHSAPAHWHRPATFAYDPKFFEQPDGTYLDGMFQSEKFFGSAADVLRLHFTARYPSPPHLIALEDQIRRGPSVAVHFRRGDYVRNSAFNREMGVISMGYYNRAVRMLQERYPGLTWFIFSDDIEKVSQEFTPPGPHVFVRAHASDSPFEHIRLMSACDHAVIGNSTFAWWGAWLNSSAGRTVIAPNPWFAASGHDGRDLLPEGWLRLARDG
jgi:hypothetical protein